MYSKIPIFEENGLFNVEHELFEKTISCIYSTLTEIRRNPKKRETYSIIDNACVILKYLYEETDINRWQASTIQLIIELCKEDLRNYKKENLKIIDNKIVPYPQFSQDFRKENILYNWERIKYLKRVIDIFETIQIKNN